MMSSHLIAIGGATGAGKTTLAYRLAREIPALSGALVLEGDQMRRQMLGYSLAYTMKPEDYTPEVSARVRALLDAATRQALMAGRSVIDASGFWREEAQRQIEALAASCGASFTGLWLDVPREVLAARIQKRMAERAAGQGEGGAPLSVERGHASDACVGVLDKYGELLPPTSPNWRVVEGGIKMDEILKNITVNHALLDLL